MGPLIAAPPTPTMVESGASYCVIKTEPSIEYEAVSAHKGMIVEMRENNSTE